MVVVGVPYPNENLLDSARPEKRKERAVAALEIVADHVLIIKEPRLELSQVPILPRAAVQTPRHVGPAPHDRTGIEDELLSRRSSAGELDGKRLLLVHRDALVPTADALHERLSHGRVRTDQEIDALLANRVVGERDGVFEDGMTHRKVAHDARKTGRADLLGIGDQPTHDAHTGRVSVVAGVPLDPLVGERQVVIVDEEEDLSARMTNGFIAGRRRILGRRNHDPDARVADGFEPAHQSRIVALLEDHHLEVGIGLPAQSLDELSQRLFTLVGPDDDRNEHAARSIAARQLLPARKAAILTASAAATRGATFLSSCGDIPRGEPRCRFFVVPVPLSSFFCIRSSCCRLPHSSFGRSASIPCGSTGTCYRTTVRARPRRSSWKRWPDGQRSPRASRGPHSPVRRSCARSHARQAARSSERRPASRWPWSSRWASPTCTCGSRNGAAISSTKLASHPCAATRRATTSLFPLARTNGRWRVGRSAMRSMPKEIAQRPSSNCPIMTPPPSFSPESRSRSDWVSPI